MDRLTAKSRAAISRYGAKMKHLESALTALNLAIDKGAEFPDAVIRVSNATGIDVDVLTAEYDRYWLSWAKFGKPRKNPAKRKAAPATECRRYAREQGFDISGGKDGVILSKSSENGLVHVFDNWAQCHAFMKEHNIHRKDYPGEPELTPRKNPAGRFLNAAGIAELSNLWHLSRTALSGKSATKYARMLWASGAYHREHPETSATVAYKELDTMLQSLPMRTNPANPIRPSHKGKHGGAHYVVELSGTKTGTTSFSCHGTKAAAVAHAKRLFAAHKTGTVKVVWFDNPKWKDGKIIEG